MTIPIRIDRGPGALKRCVDQAKGHSAVRCPHHTASRRAILGYGYQSMSWRDAENEWAFQPGEVHLAGSGLLILDDLPEFKRDVLEALGVALRDRHTLHLMGSSCDLWLRVPVHPGLRVFVTAALCPCGRTGTEHEDGCPCTDKQIAAYERRTQRALDTLRGEG